MDQRRHPRISFCGKARLSTELHAFDVEISNISLGGLHFHSDHVFDLGSGVTVEISGIYRGKRFEEKVIGKVVTVHRKQDENSFGLKFLSYLDPGHQPVLASYVQKSNKRRITSFLRDAVS